ncbi:MAG: hypothetical protein OXR73_15770 [Myxococcales bacterium]|nr:hypothetical protein [Myxococcales bacterium]
MGATSERGSACECMRTRAGVLRRVLGYACLMATVGTLALGRAMAEGYQPRMPSSASLLLQGRPQEGLLTLHSGYRNHPYIDADALVWLGAAGSDDLSGDVLTASVGVREPNGYGSARVGRFVLATGAVRPVHLDGVRLVARARGATLETFFGVPVAPGLSGRGFDWLAGGRAGQQLLGERLGLGLSYVHQRDSGMIANEEVGTDVTLRPLARLWIRGVASWDVSLEGLAAAQLHATWAQDRLTVHGFAERRVAARLLPSTSLFSTISDSAASEVGADLDYQWFPRLSVGGRAALQWIEIDTGLTRGFRATARARLALGDQGEGHALLELSRRGGLAAGYSAAYFGVERMVWRALYAHASGELVAADAPGEGGRLWPYANVGLRYGDRRGLSVAGALIARATPAAVHEVSALIRVSYQEHLLP